jgi:hypothetical protein
LDAVRGHPSAPSYRGFLKPDCGSEEIMLEIDPVLARYRDANG